MEPRRPDQMYEAFGAYVRSQRRLAQLSLRQAALLARISNPYLSQIEHGLALPSIAVISSLADALQVSTPTMLLRAVGVDAGDDTERSQATEDAIRNDQRLDDAQKHALLAVLSSFVGPSAAQPAPAPAPATRAPRRRQPPKTPAKDRRARDNV
ncbi:MAG: helix-turn-helix transcriptional regulator [Candidatus Nanopelagicales bacterium]